MFALVSVFLLASGASADECLSPEHPETASECNPSTDFSDSKYKEEQTDKYSFVGIEDKGFFIKGSVPREKAIELAGKDFQFEPSDIPGRVRCALLVADIDINNTFGIPLFFSNLNLHLQWSYLNYDLKLKLGYPEAVWMLEMREGSYLAIKAHTTTVMSYVLPYLDKYNTSYGLITLDKENDNASVSIRSAEDLVFSATLSGAKRSDISLVEKLWTKSSGGEYYRIPWGTAKPEESYSMEALMEDSLGSSVFGDVIWDNHALYYLKRKHECSMATPENPYDALFKNPVYP